MGDARVPTEGCGSARAFRRHVRAGVPRDQIDAACRDAMAAYQRGRDEARRVTAAEWRRREGVRPWQRFSPLVAGPPVDLALAAAGCAALAVVAVAGCHVIEHLDHGPRRPRRRSVRAAGPGLCGSCYGEYGRDDPLWWREYDPDTDTGGWLASCCAPADGSEKEARGG